MTATAQAEFVGKACDQVFENFKKATESTLKLQQKLLRQWCIFWPEYPKPLPSSVEQLQQSYTEWMQTQGELTRQYRESWERRHKASMESLEKFMRLAEAKDPEEFREKVLELWQKSFDFLKDFAQTQTQAFQTAIEKWMEVAKKAKPKGI